MARIISEGLSHRKSRPEEPRKEAQPKEELPKEDQPLKAAMTSLGDLTAEELAVIRKMRQKKEAVEYTVEPTTDLQILSPSRSISNNIFSVTFQGLASAMPLEAFMIDPDGKTISNVKEFTPDGTPQKVTFTLQSNDGYDAKAEYSLIVRETGSGTMALLKEPYHINISFASDFDF